MVKIAHFHGIEAHDARTNAVSGYEISGGYGKTKIHLFSLRWPRPLHGGETVQDRQMNGISFGDEEKIVIQGGVGLMHGHLVAPKNMFYYPAHAPGVEGILGPDPVAQPV